LPATGTRLAAEHERSQGDSSEPYFEPLEETNEDNSTVSDGPDQRVLERQPTEPDVAVTLSIAQPQGIPWLAVLASTWGTGIVLVATGRACHVLRFLSLVRAAETPPSAVLNMADDVGKRLGLKRVPEILLLPIRLSPLVWSLGGRPRVLLPAALFQRLDADGQEAILAHELGHVRRKDHWVRLLELLISTLFWWHPAVWWACRKLRDLEEQCCDGLVLGALPHGARAYANAIVDTLDFLSGQSRPVPLVATGAMSAGSIARRIKMLKNPASVGPLTVGRLALLAAAAALPMALAFAAQPPQTDGPPRPNDQQSTEQPLVQRRAVNRLVADFPEKTDLSTPESAQAAYHRASARMDATAVLELGWENSGPRDVEEIERFWKRDPKDIAVYNQAQLDAEVIEVLTYRDDYASVISKLEFPEGVGRNPYSRRSFGRINGVWKNLGEDRLPSVQAARESLDRKKDNLWQHYVRVRDGIKSGQPVSTRGKSTNRSARIAPDQPMGITIEKADLMGRIEWAMMHGARDVTARKSIEWGEVQKDENGNRTIRYKYYATIWDKDIYIMNQVFTFDAKGNILDVEFVERFPQKKMEKPVDLSTQEGMKELVEDFFSKNFRDVTWRESIQWGKVAKAEDGNASIRYKYRAKIWDKDSKIMNQTFTFDPKGKFVSVKDVDGFPRNP
ncbi:MAG: M56 family metallopeptidase, partial [Planctomycetes bacterium]|nr:M56 family metallopeptidase [Planctomycetota bacterium]